MRREAVSSKLADIIPVDTFVFALPSAAIATAAIITTAATAAIIIMPFLLAGFFETGLPSGFFLAAGFSALSAGSGLAVFSFVFAAGALGCAAGLGALCSFAALGVYMVVVSASTV